VADEDERPQDSAQARADAIALAEQAEAEAAEAEALAAAARARARAIKLRREAQEQDDATAETPEAPEPAETPKAIEAEPTPRRRRMPELARLSGLRTPLAVAAIVVIFALLGTSGWMLWQHHRVQATRQQSAAYVAAARQGVINLTSLDFNHAKEDVQRILDNATGEFKDEFQRRADDFASVVKDSKAVTQGSIGAAAVESTTKDSAVVLVMANERITNAAGAKDDPRAFRFRVTVVRDDGELKISKVEYVI
jgi:Mce-associated membrane protein